MSKEKTTVAGLEESHNNDKQRNLYEYAQAELKPVEYSIRAKPIYGFLNCFRLVYHFVSVLLGIATCVLISLLFVGDIEGSTIPPALLACMAVLVGGLLLAILVGVERGKAIAAQNVFKRLARRANVGIMQVFSLSFLVLISIALSAVGSALLSYKMGDKSIEIASTAKANEKKTGKKYNKRLVQLNMVIAGLESLSVDKKARRWGLTKDEKQNLREAKAERKELQAKMEKALSSITATKTAALTENKSSTNITMWVAVCLVLVLELITVFAYYFRYVYLKKTEAEGLKLGKIEAETEAKPETNFEQELAAKVVDLLAKQQQPAQPVQMPVQPAQAPAAILPEPEAQPAQAPAAKATEVQGLKRYNQPKQEKKLGKRGKSKRIDHQRLQSLLESGVSARDAANLVGCSEKTARNAKRNL